MKRQKKCEVLHSVPKKFSPNQLFNNPTIFYHSSDALISCQSEICDKCKKFEHKKINNSHKIQVQKEKKTIIPVKPNTPISQTSSERIKLTLQSYRIENKELKLKVQQLQEEISKFSLTVRDELDNDLVLIMPDADPSNVSPFMKFFWEEQQKYLKTSPRSVRYHPMIIRYCLSLASKSAAIYDDIRYNQKTRTGFLILPSPTTLTRL